MSIAVNIRGRRAAAPITGGAIPVSAPLQSGIYNVWSTDDMFVGVGTLPAVATPGDPSDLRDLTVDNGYFVPVGTTVAIAVPLNGDVIGFAGPGAATARYIKV